MRKICFISTILFLLALFAGCESNNAGYYPGGYDSSMYNAPPPTPYTQQDWIYTFTPPPPSSYIPDHTPPTIPDYPIYTPPPVDYTPPPIYTPPPPIDIPPPY